MPGVVLLRHLQKPILHVRVARFDDAVEFRTSLDRLPQSAPEVAQPLDRLRFAVPTSDVKVVGVDVIVEEPGPELIVVSLGKVQVE